METAQGGGGRVAIEQAIAALEAQRDLLGSAVVDTALAPLRQQLEERDRIEQRKLVTVLFSDLVDFTVLSQHLDAEDTRDVVNEYFQRWREAVEDQGGVVEKYIGDAVMAVFGLYRSREDDPHSAIRAALTMNDRMAELNAAFGPAYGITLAMRVGIDTGDVVVSTLGERSGPNPAANEFVAVGETVNRAARLQAAAPVGGVLISTDTHQHVRGAFGFRPVTGLQLKGIAGTVDAFEVAVRATARVPPRRRPRGGGCRDDDRRAGDRAAPAAGAAVGRRRRAALARRDGARRGGRREVPAPPRVRPLAGRDARAGVVVPRPSHADDPEHGRGDAARPHLGALLHPGQRHGGRCRRQVRGRASPSGWATTRPNGAGPASPRRGSASSSARTSAPRSSASTRERIASRRWPPSAPTSPGWAPRLRSCCCWRTSTGPTTCRSSRSTPPTPPSATHPSWSSPRPASTCSNGGRDGARAWLTTRAWCSSRCPAAAAAPCSISSWPGPTTCPRAWSIS